MKEKEYKYSKSASKTAKENNLILCDGLYNKQKRLFDFEILDSSNILDTEKEVIKADAIKHVTASNKRLFYGKMFNNFTACDGIVLFNMTRVISGSTYKIIYYIYSIKVLEHYSKETKSIYENYNVTEYKLKSEYDEPLNDIELF